MSLDAVDDLHAAEDRIGLLEAAIDGLLNVRSLHAASAHAARHQALAVLGTYCRPSCTRRETGVCESQPDPAVYDHMYCGCPCHQSDDQ